MSKELKILFFGDIVGKLGRTAVSVYLADLRKNENAQYFVIANVENASHGFGLTEKNYKELDKCGINCMTSGNHIWDKKDIYQYIKDADKLLRPINYPPRTKGKGSEIFEINGVKIGVINVLGRVFMNPVDSPWIVVKKEIKRIKKITPNVIIDFHTEATAEKICFGRFCAELGASAFFGTHTHVQTADEGLVKTMAYITDAGFCGVKDSVIGMEYKTSLKRLSTSLPERFDIPKGKLIQLNAVEVTLNVETGEALDIKRISLEKDYGKGEE